MHPLSVWHQRIDLAPTHPDSATMIQTLADEGGFGFGRMQIDFSMHILHADDGTPTAELVQIPGDSYYLPDCEPLGTAVPLPPGGAIEGETGYSCDNNSGDCHLLVVRGVELFEVYRANVTASGGNGVFDTQTFNGVSGKGVEGGTFPEVDGQEQLTFSFSEPVTLTQIGFAHIYPQGTFSENDPVGESIIVTTDQGAFTFQPTDATTAAWDGLGAVSNIDPGTSNGGGSWSIDGADILGVNVSSITLAPGMPGSEGDDDDFSFTGLQFVPNPGAATLMASAGLLGLRRRR